MKSQVYRWFGIVGAMIAPCASVFVLSAGTAGNPPAPEKLYPPGVGFRQMPIRNADLTQLMKDADVITAVRFDPKSIQSDAGKARWKVEVVFPMNEAHPLYAGEGGDKEMIIEGDPKSFDLSSEPLLDPKQGFGYLPSNEFILFLKKTGEKGVYRCLDLNPGGFRWFKAPGRGGPRDLRNFRTLLVGRVGGRLIVEGGPGYRGDRPCGPTGMLDLLRGRSSGAIVTAKAVGGATVELELKISQSFLAPAGLTFAAPYLWAEVDGAEGDSALLSAADYHHPGKRVSAAAKAIPNGILKARVELPTGPTPAGGRLTWARIHHSKSLAGSLGPGKHVVRFLCRVSDRETVMSNPVTVEGAAGAAGPEQLAALPQDTGKIMTHAFETEYQTGKQEIHVLLPDGYREDRKYRVLYVLPVEYGFRASFGYPLEIFRRMNAHNRYDLIIVQMGFAIEPWFGDHASNPKARQASYLKEFVVPFIEKTYSTPGTPEGRFLIGFSKSGFGSFSLIAAEPEFYGYAASWDGIWPDAFTYGNENVFGTLEQYARFRPDLLFPKQKKLFQGKTRLVLAGYDQYNAKGMHALLEKEGIPHYYDNEIRCPHIWTEDWMGPTLRALMSLCE